MILRRSPILALTLTELLVSIAVVSVILAFLLGVMPQIRNHAKATQNTIHHQRVIAGLLAHASDHQGNFPWCTDNTSGSTAKVWTCLLLMQQYVDNPSVFFSPWANGWWTGSRQLYAPTETSASPWYYTNYGVNRAAIMPRKGLENAKKRPANLNRISRDGIISRLMVLRDVYDESQPDRGGGVAHFGVARDLPGPQHRKGYARIHASFADGHVESYSLEEYLGMTGDPAAAPFFQNIYVLP